MLIDVSRLFLDDGLYFFLYTLKVICNFARFSGVIPGRIGITLQN